MIEQLQEWFLKNNMTKYKKIKNTLKFWIGDLKKYGLKTVMINLFVIFLMKFSGAKRIQLTYTRKKKK